MQRKQKRLLLGCLLLLLAGEVFHSESIAKASRGPRIEILPETHDFGHAKQNVKLHAEFQIHNRGDENLAIRRIATSCGCTAALASDTVVKPGASTILKVTLETRKYKGAIQKNISVASNDRVSTVRVTAFVEE